MRKVCLKRDTAVAGGVVEGQVLGMEGLPGKGLHRRRKSGGAGGPAGCIKRVAEQGMASVGQVDPDLMGPTRQQLAADQAGGRPDRGPEGFQDGISRCRRLAAARHHGHALAVPGMAADIAFDHAGAR